MSRRLIVPLAFAALLIPCAVERLRILDPAGAGTEARDSAESFQKSLVELPRKIDATTDKLLALQSTATTDKAEAFREFSKALDSQQRAAEDLGKQADAAAADSEEFFRKYVEDSMSGRDPAVRKAAMDSHRLAQGREGRRGVVHREGPQELPRPGRLAARPAEQP